MPNKYTTNQGRVFGWDKADLIAALEPTAREVYRLIQDKRTRKRFDDQFRLYAEMELRRRKKADKARPRVSRVMQPVPNPDGSWSGKRKPEYDTSRPDPDLVEARTSLPGCYMLLGIVHDQLRPVDDDNRPMWPALLPWGPRDNDRPWWVLLLKALLKKDRVDAEELCPEHVERVLIRVKADLESRKPKPPKENPQDPESPKTDREGIEDNALLTWPDICHALGLQNKGEAVRKALRVARERHEISMDDYRANENPKPREPRYLYRLSAARRILKRFLAR